MFSFSKGGFPKGVLVTPNLNESYCILKNNLNSRQTWFGSSVTRKKLLNVYKSCPKTISLEK